MSHPPDPRSLAARKGNGCCTTAVGRCLLTVVALVSSAQAQYFYNPAKADEQTPGIRYFGSAKDINSGAFLPGVSVVIDGQQWLFVLVTDEQGRFRSKLPLTALTEKVTVRCGKPGFDLVRVEYRPGPKSAARPSMQVDCVLSRVSQTGTGIKP
jgi:hypothetical protein